MISKHEQHMSIAISQAVKGGMEGGIPIGAVLVRGNQIIGRGCNRRVQQDNPILHAEIDCLQDAGRQKTYKDTVLYTTLAPCEMCAGAILQFGIPLVVVADTKNFNGGDVFNYHFFNDLDRDVIDLKDKFMQNLMATFIKDNKKLWYEDIGETYNANKT